MQKYALSYDDYEFDPSDDQERQIKERRTKTLDDIHLRLRKITQKPISVLTEADVVFLRARQSYLTETDRQTYADVLNPKKVEPKLTRAQLNEKALALGVKDPEGMKNIGEVEAAIAAAESKE